LDPATLGLLSLGWLALSASYSLAPLFFPDGGATNPPYLPGFNSLEMQALRHEHPIRTEGGTMQRLLYIESSPRKIRSASISVSKSYIEAYTQAHPTDTVEMLDLWDTPLPELTEPVLGAKYAILHGQNPSEEDRRNWASVEKLINHFKSADKYVFSLPMWNFGIPYVLKHYIDILVQPSYTFAYSADEGYKGLVTGKPATLIYARGGSYGASAEEDHQTTYMKLILGFIGITDIEEIIIQPTLGGEDAKKDSMNKARAAAVESAKSRRELAAV
jgi:FMN-dependent NADH-azoreductase